MNKKPEYRTWITLLIYLIFIIFCIPIAVKLDINDILNYTPEYPPLAFLALLGFYCLKVIITFIPLALLYISAGMIFPPFWAVLVTYLCLFTEMSIGFFIGRKLGRKRVSDFVNRHEKVKRLSEFFDHNSLFSCAFIRMLPGPSADMTSMFIGTTEVSYSKFIIGTLVGLTPGMIPNVLMGEAVTDPLSVRFLLPLAFSFLIMLCSTLAYHIVKKKKRHRENESR